MRVLSRVTHNIESAVCPIALKTNVAVLLSDGHRKVGPAGTFRWKYSPLNNEPFVVEYVQLSKTKKKRKLQKSMWIDRTTRHCPVPVNQRIRVAFADQYEQVGEAGKFNWNSTQLKGTIVKYMLVGPSIKREEPVAEKPDISVEKPNVSHEVTVRVKGVYITSLSPLLRQYVEEKRQEGLNQQKVADSLNISLHTLRSMLSGRSHVSEQVAKHMGYRPTNLYARI